MSDPWPAPERDVWRGEPYRHAGLGRPAKVVLVLALLPLLGGPLFAIVFLSGALTFGGLPWLLAALVLVLAGLAGALALRRPHLAYRVTHLAASLHDRRGRTVDRLLLAEVQSVTVSGLEQRSTSTTASNARLNRLLTPTHGVEVAVGDIKLWHQGAPRIVFPRVRDPHGVADEIRLAVQHAHAPPRQAEAPQAA